MYSGIGNRDIRYHGKPITVRSANGPQQCVIDCGGSDRAFTLADGETLDSVIQGFTIRNGSALHGGGVLIRNSSATIVDCILRSNSAGVGAAIEIREGGDLRLDRSLIIDNIADGGAGGVFGFGPGTMTVTNCVFIANSATTIGALGSSMRKTDVINSVFSQNDGGFIGGAIESASPMTLVNCVFSRNTAGRGAGVLVAAPATIVNCTFSGNSVDGITLEGHDASLTNCVLWDNIPQQIGFDGGGTVTVTFTDIQGGWPGTGNIDARCSSSTAPMT